MSDLFDFNYQEDTSSVNQVPDAPAALSVGQAVDLINDQLFRIAGPELAVEGEVSEFGISQGKWVRFTLKDLEGGALLKCFLTVYQLKIDIEDGDRVVVYATPKIYPRYGQFTLNVNKIEAVGVGDLQAQFLKLQKQLQDEGLFDASHKRSLPSMPQRIGLITSRDAAAYTDFVRILSNRWADVQVELLHCHVQGQKAVGDLLGALKYFNQLPDNDRPDVLVMTRGGGGLEDLAAFNDEGVVRAVFASKIPIVVGIGHERDESLAEYAADVRASTPSNAAERVVPDKQAVLMQINRTASRLSERVESALQDRRHATERAASRLSSVMQRLRFDVDQTVRRMENVGDMLQHALERRQERVESLVRYVQQLDPARVLQRGYAIVRKGEGVVKSVASLDKGDRLDVQLAAGKIQVEVV